METEEMILKRIEEVKEQIRYCDERDKVCCYDERDEQRYELETELQELEKELENI